MTRFASLCFISMFFPARYLCSPRVLSPPRVCVSVYFLFYFDSLSSVYVLLCFLLPCLDKIISVTCVPRVLPRPSLSFVYLCLCLPQFCVASSLIAVLFSLCLFVHIIISFSQFNFVLFMSPVSQQ